MSPNTGGVIAMTSMHFAIEPRRSRFTAPRIQQSEDVSPSWLAAISKITNHPMRMIHDHAVPPRAQERACDPRRDGLLQAELDREGLAMTGAFELHDRELIEACVEIEERVRGLDVGPVDLRELVSVLETERRRQ